MNLGHNRIILSHPWFKTFNPTINWTTNQLKGPDVQIETAGYHCKLKTEVTLQTVETTTPSMAEEEGGKIDPSILEYYNRHWEVFSEKASNQFPPACNKDHTIVLKPDVLDILNCKIYKLTEVKLQATKDFV